jgi:serine/threonine protein kinase
VYEDLEPIVKKPVILTHQQLLYLSNEHLSQPREYKKMFKDMEWTQTNSTWGCVNNTGFRHGMHEVRVYGWLGKGTFGNAFRGEYISPGTGAGAGAGAGGGMEVTNCVVKMIHFKDDEALFKETILELIVHYILDKTCRNVSEIRDRQDDGTMARVPRVYAAFTAEGTEWDHAHVKSVKRGHKMNYLVIAMEALDMNGVDFLQSRVRMSSVRDEQLAIVNTAVVFLLYQVHRLLDKLQVYVKFNHRDLHFLNIMIKEDPSKPQNCKNPYFQAYIIDFGLSRLVYKGRLITNYILFNTDMFSRHQDFLFSLLSSRRPWPCDLRTNVDCVYFIPSLNYVYQQVLDASGLDMTDPSNTPINHTHAYYDAFQLAGEGLLTHPCPTATKLGNLNMFKIDPPTIIASLAEILRQDLAPRCAGGTVPPSIKGILDRVLRNSLP